MNSVRALQRFPLCRLCCQVKPQWPCRLSTFLPMSALPVIGAAGCIFLHFVLSTLMPKVLLSSLLKSWKKSRTFRAASGIDFEDQNISKRSKVGCQNCFGSPQNVDLQTLCVNPKDEKVMRKDDV